MPDQLIKSVLKSLEVLKMFAHEKPSWSARELSEKIGISKSSAQRILATLSSEKYLVTSTLQKKYTVGHNLWRLCAAIERNYDFKKIVEKILSEYVNALNETMYLFSCSEKQVIFEVEMESSHHLRYHLELGKPHNLEVGAAGRITIAYSPQKALMNLINKISKKKGFEPNALKENIFDIKKKGYSITKGERVKGVVGIAAPVFSNNNELWGGVLLTVPEQRYKDKNEYRYAQLVIECADKISGCIK